jgi:hypothetical protein
MGRACGTFGRENECINTIFVVAIQGQRPLGRPRHRWENNIKMDLREVESRLWTGFIRLRIESSGGLL